MGLAQIADDGFHALSDEQKLLVLDVREKLRKNFYEDSDFFFQNHRDDVAIGDAYMFSILWTLLQNGKICWFNIPVGDAPSADHFVEENNEKLSKLPKPYSAVFWSSSKDEDGSFCWGKRSAPLEVGTTSAFTTWHRLCFRSASVARWPYGRDFIRLLRLRDPLFLTNLRMKGIGR